MSSTDPGAYGSSGLRAPSSAYNPDSSGPPTAPALQPGSNDESTRLVQGALLKDISNSKVRHGFIQKVYGILFAQLLCTTVVGGLLMQIAGTIEKSNPGLVIVLMWSSIIVSITMICTLACNPPLAREVPINYVILFFFTLAESVMVGFICSTYTVPSVLIVTAVTAFVVIGLSLFACQTSFDFTGAGPYLICALFVLMGIGFCLAIGSMLGFAGDPAFKALNILYAGIGALLFSFYIVFDTQLIVGGKHENSAEFEIDDYCLAAISLYLDILNLFTMLLTLLGERR